MLVRTLDRPKGLRAERLRPETAGKKEEAALPLLPEEEPDRVTVVGRDVAGVAAAWRAVSKSSAKRAAA